MKSEYKPCPFCGCHAELHGEANERGHVGFYVKCMGCETVSPARPYAKAASATRHWNTRFEGAEVDFKKLVRRAYLEGWNDRDATTEFPEEAVRLDDTDWPCSGARGSITPVDEAIEALAQPSEGEADA